MSNSVQVKSSSGEKYDLRIDSSDMTIAALKADLEKQCSIPVAEQRLIYKGYVLRDTRTVESYNIAAGHTILLVKVCNNIHRVQVILCVYLHWVVLLL